MKKDGFLIGIVILILLSMILSFSVFLTKINETEYFQDSTPENAIRNYVLAISQQDYDTAYDYLAYRENMPSLEEFSLELQRSEQEIAMNSVEIGESNISGERALVPVIILRQDNGPFSSLNRYSENSVLLLENGSWKIEEFPYPYWLWSWVEKNDFPEVMPERDEP
ncbi:MAG: DUF4878 domain-containing protein [Anaerolineaceae bacterium]|nr:DUF4878 domain-containing protein [Anaerolineaceae bacterium]